jgi:hypothetical protein
MTRYSFKQANKRYRRVFIPVMIVYSLLCFATPFLFVAMSPPPKWLVGAAAILTASPIAIVFWVLGRFLKETDEYMRQVQTQAILTGGAITLSLAVAWSFLELYQVAPRSEHFPAMIMVGPAFFLFYGLSAWVQHMRRGGKPNDMPGLGLDT